MGVFLLLVAIFLFVASRSSYVQTKLARGVANFLSGELNADITIDKVYFRPLKTLDLQGFLVKDQRDDTLLYVGNLEVSANSLNFRENRFDFDELRLENAIFHLEKIDTSGTTNLDFITSYLKREGSDTTSANYLFSAESFVLSKSSFRFYSPFSTEETQGINYSDMYIRNIEGEFSDFVAGGDSVSAQMESLSFEEKSGFEVERMRSKLLLNNEGIRGGNLSLKTNNSDIQGSIALLHNSWDDYDDFLTSVKWDTEFSASKISFKDLGYFAPELANVDLSLVLHGQINGPISNLDGRSMIILVGDGSVLRGDIDLTGLPDFENTFIDFRISELQTGYSDIVKLGEDVSARDEWTTSLPRELERAGTLFFRGNFTGFPTDFVAFGDMKTEVGSFDMDLNLQRDTLRNGIEYSGNLKANSIDAGKLFALDSLGTVSGSFKINAFSKETFESADLDGSFSSITLNNYNFRDIKLDGSLSKNRFSGSLESNDPNFDLDFDGVVDLSGDLPYYDFDAQIHNLDVTALNWIDTEESLSLTTFLSLDARGRDFGEIAGFMNAENSLICYGDSSLLISDMQLTIFGDSLNRKINFNSDIADITITGEFDPRNLPNAFNNLLAEVMPSLAEPKPLDSEENFQFSVNYVSDNDLTSLLIPELEIAANSTIYGTVDTKNRSFQLLLRSPELAFGKMEVKTINADMGKISEVFKARIFADEFRYDSLRFENPDVDIEAYNDFVDLKTGWYGESANSNADLRLHVDFFDRDHFLVELEPGYFNIKKVTWQIDEKAIFEKDSTSMRFEDFLIHAGDQELILDGSLSENQYDTLNFEVNRFELATLDSMGLDAAEKFGGTMNLGGSIVNFYRQTSVDADGGILGFTVDEYALGEVTLTSRYTANSKSLGINAQLINENNKPVVFDGKYGLEGEQNLQGNLSLKGFDLSVLNAFGIPEISNFDGFANGEVNVSGALQEPVLEGYIDFDRAEFKVDYLSTSFQFSDRVRVEPDFIGIDYKPIYDDQGHQGFVVASAFHENFSNWTYDISADVENFHVLSTTREENQLYFGEAFASGSIQLGGYEDKLEVNIDATTKKGTNISLPLDGEEEVTLENFVHFVSDRETVEDDREVDLSGVSMLLNIDATTDAQIRLIFDEQAGDILKGRGAGKITLETTEAGEFNMFGRYEILSGTYNFTLRSLINKQFDIRPGGTIGWYGDPYNADLDLTAAYSLRTPLYPIMIENRELYRSRELVNVLMNLGGKLTNPSIGFEIELPQSTQNERSQLASAVNSANQLNQQVFALLILNRFIAISAPEQAGTGVVSGLAAFGNTNTSEFISNQLSSWLSDISNEFDIGLNYRPGDQITNQEIAVALSTQLFDERLLVSGSFGVTSANEAQFTEGQSGILGDFLLEYMLTADGKIRLKVFNETNPYEVFATSTSMYTQGVGLVYQEDFDTLDEFFRKVSGLFKNDEAEKIP